MGNVDPACLELLTYGMYVVSSFRRGKLNGQIANVVFQVTAEPPLIAVSLNCQSLTTELIKESRTFSVSILSREAPLQFIGLFGFRCGRDLDKFSQISHRVLPSGDPVVLDHVLGYLDLEVERAVELGTHTLFIGRVLEAVLLDASGEPLTYALYHRVKGGRTDKNAPTYTGPGNKPG